MFITRNTTASSSTSRWPVGLKVTLLIIPACLAASSATASAKVRSVHPANVRHGVASFDLNGLAPTTIESARLSGARHDRLSRHRIRAAARRGVLRVRVASRHARAWSAARRHRLKLVLTIDSAGIRADRRKSKRPPPTTTPPPPTSPPPAPAPSPGGVLFSDDFASPNGLNNLITNEFAFWNLGDVLAVRAPGWDVTSGSLFSRAGVGWTGVPDMKAPDRFSQSSTGSAVFRAPTARADFGSVYQSVQARIDSFCSPASSPPCRDTTDEPGCDPAAAPACSQWDGVVLWPRYKTEFNLYFAYVLRRDGKVSLTKKCNGNVPGGDYYNGGTYFDLTPEKFVSPTATGQWYSLGTSAKDNADGSVTVKLYRDDNLVAQATDSGLGCAPIHAPTKLGIRSDNVDASFTHYAVSALP